MNKRKIYIDLLKIFAIFGVIYNHTAGPIIDSAKIGFMYTVSIIIFLFAKTAVPLFLAASGANLIHKEDSIKKTIYRILRMIGALFIISIFYILLINKVSSIGQYVKYVFTGEYAFSLWYLYVYIGLMVMLPIIRDFRFNRKKYVYLFSVYLMFSVGIPFITYYFGNGISMSMYFTMTFLSGYTVCFILGDFLDNKCDDLYSKRNLLIVLLVMVIDIIVSFVCIIHEIKKNGSTNFDILYGNVCTVTTFILSGCVFFVFKYLFSEVELPRFITLIIKHLSDCTFGVYLIHLLLIFKLGNIFTLLKANLNILLAIFIFDLFIYILSVAIISIIKCIPVLKKII